VSPPARSTGIDTVHILVERMMERQEADREAEREGNRRRDEAQTQTAQALMKVTNLLEVQGEMTRRGFELIESIPSSEESAIRTEAAVAKIITGLGKQLRVHRWWLIGGVTLGSTLGTGSKSVWDWLLRLTGH
jgi:hypothetical protein